MRRMLPFLTAALLGVPGAVLADYLQADRKAPVRSAADSSSERLGDVAAGDRLVLLDEGTQQNGYYHVQFNGQEGWIYRAWVRRFHGDIPPAQPTPTGGGITTGGAVTTGGKFAPGCDLPYKDIATAGLDVDKTCVIAGSGSAGSQAQNRAKNNLCAPGPMTTLQVTDFDAFQKAVDDIRFPTGQNLPTDRSPLQHLTLPSGKKIGEGSLIQVAAFIIEGHYSNVGVGKGETVNCKMPKQDDNDIHTALGLAADADECESITAEFIPHFRPSFWTPTTLNSVKRPVRITGQLFFDASHTPCRPGGKRASPARRTTWEIHPVYSIDVCKFKTLPECATADDSKWLALHDSIGIQPPEGGQ